MWLQMFGAISPTPILRTPFCPTQPKIFSQASKQLNFPFLLLTGERVLFSTLLKPLIGYFSTNLIYPELMSL